MVMTRRKRLKLHRKGKCYYIQDSPLFKLRTKKKLCYILNTQLSVLKQAKCDDNYRVFIDNSGGKPREIQAPKIDLDKVHTRLASLLVRIKTPEYLHSGTKNRTHVSNARVHQNSTKLLTTDIRSFFPSTTRKAIFNFYYKIMKCSPDIADLLTDISCYQNHVPTGSGSEVQMADNVR